MGVRPRGAHFRHSKSPSRGFPGPPDTRTTACRCQEPAEMRRRVASSATPRARRRIGIKNNNARPGDGAARFAGATIRAAARFLGFEIRRSHRQHRRDLRGFQPPRSGLLNLRLRTRRRGSMSSKTLRRDMNGRQWTRLRRSRSNEAEHALVVQRTRAIKSDAFRARPGKREGASPSVAKRCERKYTEEPSTRRSRIESACCRGTNDPLLRAGAPILSSRGTKESPFAGQHGLNAGSACLEGEVPRQWRAPVPFSRVPFCRRARILGRPVAGSDGRMTDREAYGGDAQP